MLLYNLRIILAALSGEPLRAGKGSHPSVNTGPFLCVLARSGLSGFAYQYASLPAASRLVSQVVTMRLSAALERAFCRASYPAKRAITARPDRPELDAKA